MYTGEKVWAGVRTTVFAAAFVAIFVVYLPWVWGMRGQTVSYEGWGGLRWLGIVPLVAGAAIVLRCLAAFAWSGVGTPAPFDPPRRLVTSGMYRYVRNPMYVGAGLVILGETALFGSILRGVEYVLVFGGILALFVVLYEEPTLRAKFGADYEEYCRNVPRFVPRAGERGRERHSPARKG